MSCRSTFSIPKCASVRPFVRSFVRPSVRRFVRLFLSARSRTNLLDFFDSRVFILGHLATLRRKHLHHHHHHHHHWLCFTHLQGNKPPPISDSRGFDSRGPWPPCRYPPVSTLESTTLRVWTISTHCRLTPCSVVPRPNARLLVGFLRNQRKRKKIKRPHRHHPQSQHRRVGTLSLIHI